MQIDNSAKAIIIKDNNILLINNHDTHNIGEWHCLPGGCQRPGENLVDTVKRECMEEISVVPKVGNLLFVREYVHRNHKFAHLDRNRHKIEFMFLCELDDTDVPAFGERPDELQKQIVWVALEDLDDITIYPSKIRELKRLLGDESPVYWGDIL